MTKRLKAAVLCLFCAVASACFLSALFLLRGTVHAEEPATTAHVQSYRTVAVHDPSVVLAYEDGAGNTLPARQSASDKKVYYVFGTQNAFAKSYDLVNWVNFQNNLNDSNKLFALLGKEAAYSHHANGEALHGNIWAPDVIYNPNLQKWCMYLSVNGDHQYSSIVLLTADRLDGDWSYVGPIVYSRITSENMAQTDYQKVTGRNTVAAKYDMWRGGYDGLLYGVNAIDPAVSYDDEGNLWMSYGSWFGGIYLLKLDAATGLRDYTRTYENNVINNATKAQIPEDELTQANYGAGGFTAYSDKYLGIHIAGGHQANSGGEGSYILKIGEFYYLFLSYGGYAPDGGYNMRVFRSSTITGYVNGEFVGYKDHAGNLALFSDYTASTEGTIGARVMSGYSWSNWNFSYVAQGHNSAFTDDDGTSYLVYHNKYMDGTAFHVMKVHRLMLNADGWLVCSPFEATPTDAVATGLSREEIVGKYGYLYMTRNNGRYGSPVTERDVTLSYGGTSDGMLTGTLSTISTNGGDKDDGTWTYDPATGEFTVRAARTDYRGYMLYQNIEGTNIRTLTFTAITSAFAYTYWGYRYPTAKQQAEFAASSYVFPSALGEGGNLPQGEITSTLWDGASVTFTREGNDLILNGTRYPLRESKAIAEAEAAYEGQRFTPVSVDKGISVSFDYSNYGADWVSVLHGNGFRIALGVLYDTTGEETHLYEWQAGNQGKFSQFAPNIYDALLTPNGTARATVSFHTDGSVSFYRDGVWLFTHKADTLFKNSADVAGRTVGAFTQKVLQAFAAGEVYVDYGMRNVRIGKALTAGLGENFVELGSDITCIGQLQGNATGTPVLAMPSATSGLAVTFRISGAASEWGSYVLQAGAYIITPSNLDAWTAGGKLANTNKSPTRFENGGSVQAFLNRECYITVSVSAEGVVYYRDGVRVITHGKDEYMNYNNAGASSTVKVSDFVTAFLASAANGFTVAGRDCGATDLVVTGALTDAQAKEVYLTMGHTHAALSLTAHTRVESTCTAAGTEAYWECKTCGKLYSDRDGTTEISAPVTIPAKGHSMTAHTRVEPTCTAAGVEAYWECTACHKLYSNANGTAEITAPVTLPATGHTQSGTYTHVAGTEKHLWRCGHAGCEGIESNCEFELVEINRDTCDTAGEGLLRCKDCAFEKTQIYEAGQHVYGAPQWIWTEADSGYTVTVQFVCTQNDSTLTPSATLTSQDTAADCTAAGKRVYTATVTQNGVTYTDTKEMTIPAKGHSMTAHTRVEPTCTNAGTGAYWECTACGKLFSDKDGKTEISAPAGIPAKGHAWGEWVVAREPSATAQGEEQRTCTACGEKETRPVAALGEDSEAEAFRSAVAALKGASGAEELLAAIKTALAAYGQISPEGKTLVAEEYEKVQSAIESYNALVNRANAELRSATDAAIGALASGLSAINALAVAWAVLKSTRCV